MLVYASTIEEITNDAPIVVGWSADKNLMIMRIGNSASIADEVLVTEDGKPTVVGMEWIAFGGDKMESPIHIWKDGDNQMPEDVVHNTQLIFRAYKQNLEYNAGVPPTFGPALQN